MSHSCLFSFFCGVGWGGGEHHHHPAVTLLVKQLHFHLAAHLCPYQIL